MKIKTKLLTSIGGTIIILLSISFFFLITITTGTIKEETIRELNHQTISIEEQIENLIESSAKSYLSAIGDQSDSVATTLKTLSQPEEFIIDTLLQMEIFGSGYLFITNSDGIIIGHPEKSKVGTISPMMSWLNRLKPTDKKFKAMCTHLKRSMDLNWFIGFITMSMTLISVLQLILKILLMLLI